MSPELVAKRDALRLATRLNDRSGCCVGALPNFRPAGALNLRDTDDESARAAPCGALVSACPVGWVAAVGELAVA